MFVILIIIIILISIIIIIIVIVIVTIIIIIVAVVSCCYGEKLKPAIGIRQNVFLFINLAKAINNVAFV